MLWSRFGLPLGADRGYLRTSPERDDCGAFRVVFGVLIPSGKHKEKSNGRRKSTEVLQAMQVQRSGASTRNKSRPSPAADIGDVFAVASDLDSVCDQDRRMEMPDLRFKSVT